MPRTTNNSARQNIAGRNKGKCRISPADDTAYKAHSKNSPETNTVAKGASIVPSSADCTTSDGASCA